MVDKIIAAFNTRRIQQSFPPAGHSLTLSNRVRTLIQATWTLRVSDPKKLAYRVENADRSLQLLVELRVNDTLSAERTLPRTPSELAVLSDAICAAIDRTSSKFGVRCLSFSVLSATAVESARSPPSATPTPQVQNAQLSTSTPSLEPVLPELPHDRFAALPHAPPPERFPIYYPQPQPPPPPRPQPHPAPILLPVLATLAPPPMEPLPPQTLPILPPPIMPQTEYVPPAMSHPHSLPQPQIHHLHQRHVQQSITFPPHFPPLTWPQPLDQEPSETTISSLEAPVSMQPIEPQRSISIASQLLQPSRSSRRVQHSPDRQAPLGQQQLEQRQLPPITFPHLPNSFNSDSQSPTEPHSSSAESQTSTEATASTEQRSSTEELSRASQPQQKPEASALQRSSSASDVKDKSSPLPGPTSRKPLRAPPPSPVIPAITDDARDARDILTAHLHRALEPLQSHDVDALSPPLLPQTREPGDLSPNFAKYLHELPATPANLVPSSESSDACDTVVGKPLPMETRIPGVSDRPPSDDGQADEDCGVEDYAENKSSQRQLVPVFPSVASLGPIAAVTAMAVKQLAGHSSNQGGDPPSSIESTGQGQNIENVDLARGEATTEVRVGPHQNEEPPVSEKVSARQATPHVNTLRSAYLSPLPAAPLPPTIGSSTDAVPSGDRDAMEEEFHGHPGYNEDGENQAGDNSSTEAVHDKNISSSDDDEKRGSASRVSGRNGNTSLLSSVVGKTERLRSAGVNFASDLIDAPLRLIQARSNTARIKDSSPSSPKSSRRRLAKVLSPKKEQNHSQSRDEDFEERLALEMSRMEEKQVARRDERDDNSRQAERNGVRVGIRDRAFDDERLKEQLLQRERLLDELDGIRRAHSDEAIRNEDDSTDADSLDMCMDDGSDSERATFDDEALARGEAHSRRKRAKSSHRHRHRRRQEHYEDMYNDDVSSNESFCTECGRDHGKHDGEYSTERSSRGRRRKSRKHSNSSDTYYDDEDLELYHGHRSSYRNRGSRHRRSSSERGSDSHSSSSHKERHRRRKCGSRERGVDDEPSSSKRSRSVESKHSHSRRRSSSRGTSKELDGERRHKSSKGKSRSRRRHHAQYVPVSSDLHYPHHGYQPPKSIYRHRLPESGSEEEEEIPWYCEGQSAPEDTGRDERSHSMHDNEDRRSRNINPMKYSSYGRRDRYGRKRGAHHNRTVHFLYDERRR